MGGGGQCHFEGHMGRYMCDLIVSRIRSFRGRGEGPLLPEGPDLSFSESDETSEEDCLRRRVLLAGASPPDVSFSLDLRFFLGMANG